jgi:hypothetical protein
VQCQDHVTTGALHSLTALTDVPGPTLDVSSQLHHAKAGASHFRLFTLFLRRNNPVSAPTLKLPRQLKCTLRAHAYRSLHSWIYETQRPSSSCMAQLMRQSEANTGLWD